MCNGRESAGYLRDQALTVVDVLVVSIAAVALSGCYLCSLSILASWFAATALFDNGYRQGRLLS